MKIKVNGKNNYYRDMNTKAIIIDDSLGLKKAKELKSQINKRNEEIEDLKRRMENIENLLKKLLEK